MDIIYTMQREMLRRGYSPKTISTYVQCIRNFMKFCKKDMKVITKADIKRYLDKYIDKQCAGNTINVNLNALKFLMEEILGKRVMLKIKYSKVPKTAPIFLTKDEIKKLFDVVENEKHLLILEILYSAGLRVSEVINLRRCDFEFGRGIGWVRKGKGMKDRPFIIAKLLEPKLNKYIENNCNSFDSYLFTGYNGRRLHVRSIQEIVKRAAKKAGIEKNIHPHSLRHSYATHLIENGYDINTIQPLLGHNSAETTMRYVHMANPKMIKVVSPYDNL
ncbi:hypothetical protein A3I25_00335 [Candidatus Nomurabacteria bacterium RIFCSPLOWO2_02_FULL_42_17]|uniref:Integrase n=1 Tax=Candidatus Nomurabacteria bacterium RIFCSPLOWO2_02_FULL_42_17 TaxID=1801789 RepID=A0A1F6XQT7_9BACT|nr:MAG: hypothetical protein A3I25_00335 [Candidatus Nomurabacteria bacterium RIFCSPLOWO2_02_FULL_42_17]HIH12590.1 tyrosine-type recombinase/integrase [Candidatus Woesearchaeota archaeon]